MVLILFIIAFLLFGCSSMERDNPYDPKGKNSSLKKCEDIFNSATHFCYDGGIYALCNGIDYNPTAYYCESFTVKQAKCGSKEYNPLIEGCCGSAVFELSNQRCGAGSVVETQCGVGWYNAINQRCGSDDIVETKCGDDWFDSTNVKLQCQNNVMEMKCGEYWYNKSSNLYCLSNSLIRKGEKGTFVDARDSNTYKAVEINGQVWMAENLNYAAEGSRCYGEGEMTSQEIQANCAKYGRLYDWATAMNIDSIYNSTFFSTPSTVKYRGVCPSGWHLPSDTEWSLLINYVDGFGGSERRNSPTAGKILKAISGWNSYDGTSGNGADTYGFTALPGGKCDYNSYNDYYYFYLDGTEGYWWSGSATSDTTYSSSLIIPYNGETAYMSYDHKFSMLSVRCLQD